MTFLIPTGSDTHGIFVPAVHKKTPLIIDGVSFSLEKNGKKVKIKAGKMVRTVLISSEHSVFSIIKLESGWSLKPKDKPAILSQDKMEIASKLWDLGFTNQKLTKDNGMRLDNSSFAAKCSSLAKMGLSDSNFVTEISNGHISIIIYKPESSNKYMPLMYHIAEDSTIADYEDIENKIVDFLSMVVERKN